MIDPVSLTFYGIVCTVLAVATPAHLRLWIRAALGAAVGIWAAFMFPIIRGMLGL